MSLRELDFNNAGVWPRGYKIGACILLMLIIIGLAWWLFVSDKRTELQALEQHGAAAGSYLTVRRLVRCHPWCAGGSDPVPAERPRLFTLGGASGCAPISQHSSQKKSS